MMLSIRKPRLSAITKFSPKALSDRTRFRCCHKSIAYTIAMSSSAKPAHEQMADSEKAIRRNHHRDFKKVEAGRPPYRTDAEFTYTKTVKPDWKFGSGANDLAAHNKKHVEIDPYAEGRSPASNYKLLISAIVPRPIGFCSTVSKDGEYIHSLKKRKRNGSNIFHLGKSSNLAPFSYFNVINHDPPLFIFGFAGGLNRPKDSLRNLIDTKECTPSSLPSYHTHCLTPYF
jgi:hypothetical protein